MLAEIARTSIVVLSTHQTEDVAALCERVIVLDRGRVRYDGQVTELVRRAAGRVWLADHPDPAATVSWRTGTGRYRNIAALAARELRRFLVNPVLLFAVVMTG